MSNDWLEDDDSFDFNATKSKKIKRTTDYPKDTTARSKEPWVGNVTPSKESRLTGGYFYYMQVRWFDGKDHKNKKFYYDQGDEQSETKAKKDAGEFRKSKAAELGVTLDE